MRWLLTFLGSCAALGMFMVHPLAAQDVDDPYVAPNDTWISLDGEVETVMADRFTLDYGDGLVTVEFDDGDRDADAYKLMSGDRVIVYGIVDDDLFERTTIEAAGVYVENLGTYFKASALDEEDTFVTVPDPIIVSRTVIQGTVTGVGEDHFTLNSDGQWIRVDTSGLEYDPLDDEGYQKISAGDYVSVAGNVDESLFLGHELDATSVITLYAN